MANMIKTLIERWDGGISTNPRDNRSNIARMVRNFDVLSDPFKLKPYRDTEDGDENATTYEPKNFVVAKALDGNYKLHALGKQSGGNDGQVRFKDLSNGATATDLDDNSWDSPSSGDLQSTGTICHFDAFTYYENQGKIYSFRDNQYIQSYNAHSPSSGWTDTEKDLGSGIVTFAEGLVHSKDDIVYMPYDNKIASKDGASAWVAPAVTLPESVYITSICEYGNYIAIATAPKSGTGSSRVYLWNRDSTLEEMSESIDWGSGALKILETIDGILVGVSLVQTTTTNNVYFDKKLVFRAYTNKPSAEKIFEIKTEELIELRPTKQVEDNRLLFQMNLKVNGNYRAGTWSFGRSGSTGQWVLNHEVPFSNNSTATSLSSPSLYGFYKVGDYTFQSFDKTTFQVSKTETTGTAFTTESIYESAINPNLPPQYEQAEKVLVSVMCSFEALSGGSVKLEYRVDAGSWVAIITESEQPLTFFEVTNDSNGDQFEKGREYEFRITSTGDTGITQFRANYEVEDTHHEY